MKIRCLKCNDIIESMSLHDCRDCKCGACHIDGGTEYTRIGAQSLGMAEESIFVNSDISKPEITVGQILSNRRKNEIILFKASHKINLKRVINLLTEVEGRK